MAVWFRAVRFERGSTLIEVLIVTIIIGILIGIVMPVFQAVQERAQGESAREAVMQGTTVANLVWTAEDQAFPVDLAAQMKADFDIAVGGTSFQLDKLNVDRNSDPIVTLRSLGADGTAYAVKMIRSGPGASIYRTKGTNFTAYTNEISNPSVESNLNGWPMPAWKCAGSRSDEHAYSGLYGFKCIADGTGSPAFGPYQANSAFPAVPGDQFYSSAWVYYPISGQARVCLRGFDNANANMGSPCSAYTTIPAKSWTRIGGLLTVPAGSTKAGVYVAASNGSPAAGTTFYADAISAVQSPVEVPYFDGDYPNCGWFGVAHDSRSKDCLAWDRW